MKRQYLKIIAYYAISVLQYTAKVCHHIVLIMRCVFKENLCEPHVPPNSNGIQILNYKIFSG